MNSADAKQQRHPRAMHIESSYVSTAAQDQARRVAWEEGIMNARSSTSGQTGAPERESAAADFTGLSALLNPQDASLS